MRQRARGLSKRAKAMLISISIAMLPVAINALPVDPLISGKEIGKNYARLATIHTVCLWPKAAVHPRRNEDIDAYNEAVVKLKYYQNRFIHISVNIKRG